MDLVDRRRIAREHLVELGKVARVESATLTQLRYAIPKSFDANAFFRETFGLYVGGGRPFRFRVRFTRAVAGWYISVRIFSMNTAAERSPSLISRMRASLDVEISIRALFEAPVESPRYRTTIAPCSRFPS